VKGYQKTSFSGAFVGIFTGVWHGLGRTASGFYDMAGFWAADPKSNDGVGIPLDAEYAWQEGEHHSLTSPKVVDATVAPMGNKLMRGVGNTLFGFAEFPGQIWKGVREHAFDLGIGKGLWYWFSREVDGVYDAATFIVPNPKDTKGLAYDEKWPWSALGDSMK
jgi:putative exosortase-associated protein (TIGR04073 family)